MTRTETAAAVQESRSWWRDFLQFLVWRAEIHEDQENKPIFRNLRYPQPFGQSGHQVASGAIGGALGLWIASSLIESRSPGFLGFVMLGSGTLVSYVYTSWMAAKNWDRFMKRYPGRYTVTYETDKGCEQTIYALK